MELLLEIFSTLYEVEVSCNFKKWQNQIFWKKSCSKVLVKSAQNGPKLRFLKFYGE